MPQPQIIRANSRHLPLADDSVDLVVTSPPYFGLRSYQDGGEHYAGQIGDEPTPVEFVDGLLEVTKECVRVLKPSGSLWVNLGDKYVADNRGSGSDKKRGEAKHAPRGPLGFITGGMRQKSLMGIPWRYAIRCIDELGLILRAEVIWSKPNGLPESVTDRVRRSHEQWFHFTLNPRYYSAVDTIREQHKPGQSPSALSFAREGRETAPGQTMAPHRLGREAQGANPLGKLPGSVWTIPTQPLRVPESLGIDHFAAFPMEWPRRIIQGWSPEGVCADCGFLLGSSYDSGVLGVRKDLRTSQAQRSAKALLRQDVRQSLHGPEPVEHEVPSTDDPGLCGDLDAGPSNGAEERLPDGASILDGRAHRPRSATPGGRASQERGQDRQSDREPRTAGEGRARPPAKAAASAVRVPSLRRHGADLRDALPCPNCGGTSFRPAVVADPFGGTGTTALLAKALGRRGITVDMSADYCRLAQWRTNDPDQLASAMQIDKPAKQIEGQGDLLSMIGEAI